MEDLLRHRITRRQFLRITAVAGITVAVGNRLIRAMLQTGSLHQVRETRIQMGTLVTISVVHPVVLKAQQIVADSFAEMVRLEGILSRHRQGTSVSRLNSEGDAHGMPVEAVHVIKKALEYSALSDGAFDITVKPLLDLYSESFMRTGMPPSETQVQNTLSLVGHQRVLVDENSVAFERSGMSITLDGIAKGYIVDRTVDVLKERGAEQVLVDAGGDMGSASTPSWNDEWRVAVQDPRTESGPIDILHLRNESIATSGDYLQYFTEDKRLHHIIDPRTGRSPGHTSAVTVVAPTAMDADALSTAVMVLGPQDGLQLLNQLENVEGLIVTKEQDILRSKGLSRYTH